MVIARSTDGATPHPAPTFTPATSNLDWVRTVNVTRAGPDPGKQPVRVEPVLLEPVLVIKPLGPWLLGTPVKPALETQLEPEKQQPERPTRPWWIALFTG